MNRLSIRWRLTLWYGAVVATVLAVFGTSVYMMMQHELLFRLDDGLDKELKEIVEEVEDAPSRSALPAWLDRRFSEHEGYEFQVCTVRGESVFRSSRIKQKGMPVPLLEGSPQFLDHRSIALGELGNWRVVSRLVTGPDSPLVVQAAVALAPDEYELNELLVVLLLAGPLALAGALGGGYLLARKALGPVDRMAAAADEITASRLDRRIEVPIPGDELGRLARTLNSMIARLERSFEEIRRFTADAAHELRTPLAVMRSEAEVALRAAREPEQYRRVLEDMLEEIERLTRLAEQLLFLCREDAGLVPLARDQVRFDEVVSDVADHMRVVAEEKGITLRADSTGPCQIKGDADRLRQLLFNLLDNAIKFTLAGGTVSVRCERLDERVQVVVADTGIGIPAEHLGHIFDRFYRADSARGPDSSGTGLGLAISRSIATAHGGQIRVESAVGRGTQVILTLPIQQPEAAPARRFKPPEDDRGQRASTG